MAKPSWNERKGNARHTKHYRARIVEIERDLRVGRPQATPEMKGVGDDSQRQRAEREAAQQRAR